MLLRIVLFSLLVSFVHLRSLDEDKLLYWRRANAAVCEPFTTSQEGCNRCVCAADGVTYCTRMACLNKRKPDQRFTKSDEDDEENETAD
ncbi:uncharacterized protein LOC116412951 isoform X2 [Galleria mellonella]|uniref:Uncharacterized protein LOC116412951 isoform X2 n=1 Tax=Galleria mellonella TaxID=7137 RepID=A0ABM3MEQ8_GALME|nr:uncharacterized protein LOC116412951 isoform X2 [Galleria mellonella]